MTLLAQADPTSSEPRRIIVVGCNGYLGAPFLRAAAARGAAIGTSSHPVSGQLLLDLRRASDFDYPSIQAGDLIYLLAAISSPDLCSRDKAATWAVNVQGTSEFMERAIDRGARVIFFSSDTVYGEQPLPFDERAACQPAGDYAAMKRAVEERFASAAAVKTMRLSYVFSNEDKFTKYLVHCAKTHVKADIYHPFFRAIVYRDDVIQAGFALGADWTSVPDRVINVGGPEVLARTEYAAILRQSVLPELETVVSTPTDDFFINRPREIRMLSPILTRLLRRTPRTLADAARMEFENRPEPS